MNVKIVKSETEKRISNRTGKQYEMQCLLVELDGETRKIELFHNEKAEIYKPGVYKIADSSFQVENKNLVLKWLKFEPVLAQAQRATA